MTFHCANKGRYDFCNHCKGYDTECPEYEEDFVNFLHNQARKSPSVEKPFGTTDYEPTNGVVVEGNRIPSQQFQYGTHSESYSRPVEFKRLGLLEPILTRRDFIERFRRFQR